MDNHPDFDSCRYTLPGILHFLQHEWSQFELERAQWESEKAELQATIAFLQGERRGQENLKRDLIRSVSSLGNLFRRKQADEQVFIPRL
jgi:striatin 1/3/4